MAGSLWRSASGALLIALAVNNAAWPAAPAETATPPQTPAASAPAAAESASRLSTPGSGDVIVRNPFAVACEDAAKIGDRDGAGAEQCTEALGSIFSQSDVVALHTDRGAVYLQHRQWALAKADFDAALTLDGSTADAYVDRGAALLGLRRYADAIADIDRGLALKPDQPEKAYFNRAIADEHLEDLKSAYQDYLKASELNPGWAAPKMALTRIDLEAEQPPAAAAANPPAQ